MTGRNTSDRLLLTSLQQAILGHLWSAGPATAEQVREALRPVHRLKDSSIRTLLRRLEARGLVRHHVEGKVFRFVALAPPHRVAAGTVRQLIDGFWAGSVEQFLVGMVDEKVVTPEELQRLAKRVRGRK